MFQFTHPCGCDDAMDAVAQGPPGFNSRTRVGATEPEAQEEEENEVSIHAPVWVRLYKQVRNRAVFLVSIHAPVWVRPPQEHGYGWKAGFQFTHPCGCDLPPVIDI